MFGIYRLVLALTVAASHMGVSVGGYHIGVVAVMGFYLLAGYIAVPLWEKALKVATEQHSNVVWCYWKERFWRLMPAYWGVMLLTALLLPVLPPSYFLQGELDWNAWLQNILLLPLAYYPLSGIDHITLIPPAWSLAVEVHYYLLAPFLMVLPVRYLNILWAGSLFIWLLSFTSLVDAELWGYRYFAGMLFVFITGQSLWHARLQKRLLSNQAIVLAICLVLLMAGMVLLDNFDSGVRFRFETCIGLGLAMVFLVILGGLPRRAWDDRIGKYAYLIFLSHFLLYWLFVAQH